MEKQVIRAVAAFPNDASNEMSLSPDQHISSSTEISYILRWDKYCQAFI
jgi:hypothetical protein